MTDVPHRALVTGASRGIGQAVALALSGAGYHVAVCARSQTGMDETVARAQEAGGRMTALAADVGMLDACRLLPARAQDALGGPADVFVHCAGISLPARLVDLSIEAWEESMRVNTTSAFVLAQGLAPPMIERGWGRIITIGSLYSRMGAPFSGPYAVSKHALLGLTRVLAVELVGHGITANCVVPGWTDTEMVRDEARNVAAARGFGEDEAIRRFLRNQPLGRMVQPAEVGALVAFLASDAAAAITAQAFNIDGGSLQS